MNKSVLGRFQLMTLLSEACELEHGLACCYLYAAVSLKQDLAEGGLSWEQLQKVRLWASQVFHVAAEEMLHLAQAWNLLTAIGGTPWYERPNFPQPSRYYPLHLPLETQPFSLETLERFIAFEHPHDSAAAPLPPEPGDDTPAFRSVGELYARIAAGITAMPEEELFIGDPDHQVGPELIDFPNITPVVSRASALQAIETITEQGEGTPGNRDDSHYDIFRRTRKSLLEQTLAAEERSELFEPVRPCISNPVAFAHPFLGAPGANEIGDTETAAVADTFDAIYQLMLRLLQYVFDSATGDDIDTLRPFASAALQLMTTVIKPLSEALALMPAGQPLYGAATAGPTFATGRNVPLPLTPALAQRIAEEKLAQLRRRLDGLVADRQPAQLQAAARNLERIDLQMPAVTSAAG
jgi:hypothetical protein